MWVIGFCHEHALILYVYLPNENGTDESVLTVCYFSAGCYKACTSWLGWEANVK